MSSNPSKSEMKSPEASGASWMITFADLLSLLLTFFVLLFSMSTVQFDSWKAVVNTMSDEFNPERPQIDITPHEIPDHLKKKSAAGLNLNYLQSLFSQAVESQAGLEGTVVTQNSLGVVISIPAHLLFEKKDAQLVTGAVRPLRRLAGTLVQIQNKVKVEGHTDPGPVTNRRYRSNWELSMARARMVAGILTDFGYTQSITVLGHADTGIQPVSIQGQDLAERVDIVIIADRREKGPYDLF